MRVQHRHSNDFQADLRKQAWDVGVGFFRTFAPYTLVLVLLLVLSGPEVHSRGGTIRVDLLIVTYPLGAFVTGWLAGLLAAVCRHVALAVPAGILAITPWLVGISLAMDHGYSNWTTEHTAVTATTAVLLGGSGGIALWLSERRTTKRRLRARRDS